MLAMVLELAGPAFASGELADPVPGPGQVLVRVKACAVCRTDLHVVDGELPDPKLPLIPGHEIVGEVVACGPGASAVRVGAAGWHTVARSHLRRLPLLSQGPGEPVRCAGLHRLHAGRRLRRDAVADAGYCLPMPDRYGDAEVAPLLCAGLIGWRTLRMAGDARRLGIWGFGAAAHIVAQVARHEGRELYRLHPSRRHRGPGLRARMGAAWAGDADEPPPGRARRRADLRPGRRLVPPRWPRSARAAPSSAAAST